MGPPLVIGVGVMAAGVVLMLWWRHRDATFWRERPRARLPELIRRGLAVDAAALGEHLHEVGDPLGPRRRGVGGVHPPEDGVAVGAVQRPRTPSAPRARRPAPRRGRRDGDRRRAGVGPLPPAVGLRRLDRGQSCGAHPPLGDQPLDRRDVLRRPDALRPPGCDALEVEGVVEPVGPAVDPAEAEQHLDHLLPVDRRDARALLGDLHVEARGGRRPPPRATPPTRPGRGRPATGRSVGRVTSAILGSRDPRRPAAVSVSRRCRGATGVRDGRAGRPGRRGWQVGDRQPAPSVIWLVRHGESMGNVADAQAQKSGAGRLELDIRDPDVPLSDTGRAQAEALGTWLADAARGRAADGRAELALQPGADDRPAGHGGTGHPRAHRRAAAGARLRRLRRDDRRRHPRAVPRRGRPPRPARQVLLPAARRRELGRRRPADPQPAGDRGPAARLRPAGHRRPPGRDHGLPVRAGGADRAGAAHRSTRRSRSPTPRSPATSAPTTAASG